MPPYSKPETIAAENSSHLLTAPPPLSLRKSRRLTFGPPAAPFFYLVFVLCFWASSSLHTGMTGELLFAVSSDEQSWWEAFFFGDPIRVYTNLFYHAGYLLSEAMGIPGSYLGYQIVFGFLLWARAVLLFLVIHRTLPGSFWLAFTAGTIELFHAADRLTNWLGQINQHNYIFWLFLSFYCIAEAFRATRTFVKFILSVAAAIALYLCMWSYEAAVMLASIGPLFILLGGKLACGKRITWLDGLCLLILWSVLACYTFENVERYLVIGAQSSYQYAQLRKSFSIVDIADGLIFSVYHSLAFWTWLPRRLSTLEIGNGLLACALWSVAALLASGSRADRLVPDPRILVGLFISGLCCLIAAFSVFMLLDTSQGLARTQFLSAAPTSLVWVSLLWLAAYPLRKVQLLGRLAPTAIVALIIFSGAAEAYHYGALNKDGWNHWFRAGYSGLLRTVPDLLPGTVVVMIAPEARAPASEDLWFDAGLRLAYPQVRVKGTLWLANQKPISGQDLVLKNGTWVWQKKAIPLGQEPIPFEKTVIVELNDAGQAHVLNEVPSFISEDPMVREAYRPSSRILCGAPNETALNRYEILPELRTTDCVKPAVQAIKLTRASFGLDCVRKSWAKPFLKLVTLGNETKRIQRMCHGLSRCEFDVVAENFDDPLPACGQKELAIAWTCGESSQLHSTRISNAFDKHVELACDAN
ncbi:MAG: hypothetical protein JO094_17555 [Hyphomicrobiales bacterium]|nr:hypothetical protein [Hyphomicrobiales bacterium]